MLSFLPNLIRAFVLFLAGIYIRPALDELVRLGYLDFKYLEESYNFIVTSITVVIVGGGMIVWAFIEKHLSKKKIKVLKKKIQNQQEILNETTQAKPNSDLSNSADPLLGMSDDKK